MDELLIKQLTRQLKLLNLWITVFGTLFLVSLIVIGVLVFKLLNFVHHTAAKVDDLQNKTTQSLNVQKKLCSNGFGSVLKKGTGACD